jgi:hypothetical protein
VTQARSQKLRKKVLEINQGSIATRASDDTKAAPGKVSVEHAIGSSPLPYAKLP